MQCVYYTECIIIQVIVCIGRDRVDRRGGCTAGKAEREQGCFSARRGQTEAVEERTERNQQTKCRPYH